MHAKRNKIWIGLFSGLVIVAILTTLIARIPSTSQQIPPNLAPILVVLSHPVEGSTWPADTPIPVAVTVTAGAAIKSVEFWTDGRLFDTQILSASRQILYKVWSWMPLTEGTHAVFVRAIDTNGQTANSNAVHIQASAAAGLIAVFTAQGGETIQSLAEKNGVTPEQIAAKNPSIDPTGSIEPGAEVFIPGAPFKLPPDSEPIASLPPSGPVVAAEEGALSGPAFSFKQLINRNANSPSAPALSASVNVCNVTLTIQDNSTTEDGFFVYALPESSVSFKRITSLKAHTGASALQYTVQNQRGQVQFYVSSYNTAGETSSNPVAVNVSSPQCKPAQGNSGDLKYQGGFLSVLNNVQLAYFYASINGGAWQRIPPGKDFLEPMTGQIDLRPKIQQLLGGGASGVVDLDVWGWSGGALVHLGQLHINANFASLKICNLGTDCSGDIGATQWVTEAVVGSDKTTAARKLSWYASGADITHAIWQVSTQPFPADYSVGAPPGLLISGISTAEVNTDSGMAGGQFTIDFKNDLQFTGTGSKEAQPTRGFNLFGQKSGFNSDLLSVLKAELNSPFLSSINQALLTQTLYIRVTPIAGNHPATDPSNSVVVTLEATGTPPPIHIYAVPTYSVEIVPDSYVNEVKTVQKMGVLGCSTISGVDHDVYITWYLQAFANMPVDPGIINSMAEASYQFWAGRIGWQACPGIVELHEDSVWDQLGAAFEGWWNMLSSALEEIKSTLVNALASIIPGCDATCRVLLTTGLNFAITYFTGLPPSMPSFDDMVNMGVDYAVQMAISQAGIPYCDQTCQDAIAGEIKGVASDVAKSGKSQPGCAAQNHTLWVYEGTQLYHLKPLCFPPGVSFEPLKGSMYERAMVQVRVTRIDGSPDATTMQQLAVDTQAINPAFGDVHTGSEYFQSTPEFCNWLVKSPNCASQWLYHIVYFMPIEGIPYPPITISVPALKAGQSVVIPVVFNYNNHDTPSEKYLPRAAAIQNQYPGVDLNTTQVDWWRDFVHLTDSGSQITISAHALCQDKELTFLWNSPCSEIDTRQFVAP